MLALLQLLRERIPRISVPVEQGMRPSAPSREYIIVLCMSHFQISKGGSDHAAVMVFHMRSAGQGNEKLDLKKHKATRDTIPCYDPGNMAYLGTMPADSAEAVRAHSPHMACMSQ